VGEIRVSAEQVIHAPAARVYKIIADYNQHHPNILPPAFSDLRVEEGSGVGEGTVISFNMTAGGRKRHERSRITEPEPGRVLIESGIDSSVRTVFTVTPDGANSRVRFDTTWNSSSGIGGFFERLFAPRMLKSIYANELAQLDHYAQQVLD
jgi:hypothetical protein